MPLCFMTYDILVFLKMKVLKTYYYIYYNIYNNMNNILYKYRFYLDFLFTSYFLAKSHKS